MRSRFSNLGELVQTADGSASLVHPKFDQAYHSLDGAKKEAQDLYVNASGFLSELDDSKSSEVRVLDVGLGLGYNALVTIEAWAKTSSSKNLNLVSLESNEDLFLALCSGEAPWQSDWSSYWLDTVKTLDKQAADQWKATLKHPNSNFRCTWTVLLGNATTRSIVPSDVTNQLTSYDYIWQDPFSPEMNPDMWSVPWFTGLAETANERTKLMTYSVSRKVKDALTGSGWGYSLIETTTSKRSWLKANIIKNG